MWLFQTLAFVAAVGVVQGDGNHAHLHTSTTSENGGVTTQTISETQSNQGPVGVVPGGGDAATVAKYLEANPALAAAAAAALGGGGGYDYPPPPATGGPVPPPQGGLGGLGALYGLPWGFQKSLNLDVNGGVGGGLGPYYPIIEKAIAIVGGGILILLILAFLQGSLSAGGFLHGLGSSFSKAIAGSATVDLGPIQQSAAGAASFNLNDGLQVSGGRLNDPRFNERVSNSFDRRF